MRICEASEDGSSWLDRMRGVVALMREDVDVVLKKDPAARRRLEVLLYPHIHALWMHRVAHALYGRRYTTIARAMSMCGRWLSGIDIHPGACIGRRFFIDHGGAVVIGETVIIGDDVMLYHQVTLGSVGWWRDLDRPSGARRHPKIEDAVVISTNASVLGPITVGASSHIGAHAVVLDSVPPNHSVSAAKARPAQPRVRDLGVLAQPAALQASSESTPMADPRRTYPAHEAEGGVSA